MSNLLLTNSEATSARICVLRDYASPSSISMMRRSKHISRRKADFVNGMIIDCYIVFNGEAVRVNARYQTRLEIEQKIAMLKP